MLCIDAKRAISEGRSPAIERQREKRRLLEAKSFGEFGEKWLTAAPMADSTRAMRRSIFERELLPKWRSRLLTEITPDDLRAHCGAIVERGAPATAIHVRDILRQIYGFAILHGEKVANPADDVGPSSIATFVPKDRSLSPTEIRLPTVAMGLLALALPPAEAAAILVVPSLVTNVWQLLAGPSFGELARRLWPMMLGVMAGTVAGAGVPAGTRRGWGRSGWGFQSPPARLLATIRRISLPEDKLPTCSSSRISNPFRGLSTRW